jgi:hypothetical protein
MSQPTANLERQLARVRRRLFLGLLLNTLVWSWVVALAVAVGWFVVQPYLFPTGGLVLRSAVAGGLVGVGTIVGLVLACLRGPSRVEAALAIDERFRLRERVTTSLTLRDEEIASPAGQALLEDVERHLAPLRVGDRFPIAVPWRKAVLVPVVVAILVLLAFFWNPQWMSNPATASDLIADSLEARAEIENKMQALAKRQKPADQPRSKDAKEIEAELDKFVRKPHDTEDAVRDRIKEASELEARIRKQQQADADRAQAVKERMEQIERLKKRKPEEKKDGPGKDLDKAMTDADFQKAKEEAERLSRKLLDDQAEIDKLKKKLEDEGGQLQREEREQMEERLKKKKKENEKEQEQLEEQLQDLQERVERLSRKTEDEKKDLEDKAEKGEISKEELERELNELEKNKDQLEKDQEEMKDLAEKLGECKQCMKEGKTGEAAEKLKQAAGKMGQLGKEGEQKERARQLAQIREVRRAMSRAVGGPGGPGAGRRPEAKEGETGEVERRERVEMEKGKLEVIGTAPGKGYKGPARPEDLQDEIKQAAQEAPAAIDRQRLPPSARKMAKGYFEKVRGPEKDKK